MTDMMARICPRSSRSEEASIVRSTAHDVRPRRMVLRTTLTIAFGLAMFYAVVRSFDSWVGAAIAAGVAGVATGLVWWLWRYAHRPHRPEKVLGDIPRLGIIPLGRPNTRTHAHCAAGTI